MSSSKERIIEKGILLVFPDLSTDSELYKDIREYIKNRLEGLSKVALLYANSDSFRAFLEKHDINPDEALGRKDLIVTKNKVSFTENYCFPPQEVKLSENYQFKK